MPQNTRYQQVMEAAGFYKDGKPAADVLDADALRKSNAVSKRMKYDAVIDREKLNASAIFELSGSPCIYFRRLDQAEPSPQQLAEIRKIAWNNGLAPLLWVITPSRVLIYSCFSKPTLHDQVDANQHLIRLFETTASGLEELNSFAGRTAIESGTFWARPEASRINRRQRVDASLLDDLREAEAQLVRLNLDRTTAHTLLGRSIFVAYLRDRGILDAETFARLFGSSAFVQLLANKPATYRVFDWVQTTFNGDLFPLDRVEGHGAHERDVVQAEHLEVVQELLYGYAMASRQRRLWPYNFDVIPVELISSIYEMFAHAGDSETAEALSTHYTPTNLVDLVLSQVFEGLPANANVLDLACGSGVFLVESLRRLAAQRLARGEKLTRKLVRSILYEQIYGVDISAEAVEIAAFSLYLTALELDPSPEPLQDLKFKPLIGHSLFVSDALDPQAQFNKREPFVSKRFGAIVGNPPWTRSRASDSAVMYCKERGYPLAKGNPGQAFLWRAGDLSNKETVVGLILPARPFFSHTGEAHKAKKALMERFAPLSIVNLADLRQADLFPTSNAPAMIFVAQAHPSEDNSSFSFVSPKLSEPFKRHGIIEIGHDDIKQVSVHVAATNPDSLKIASWGSARDMELVRGLQASFGALGGLIKANEESGWVHGVGYKTGNRSLQRPKLHGKRWLSAGELPRYEVDPAKLGFLPTHGFERPRNPYLYRAPLVIATRGLSRAGFYSAFSGDDVIFPEVYYGISVPKDQVAIAHYLNGILNSSLASYFLFMTSSSWGVERDEVKPKDLERLPIPEPSGQPLAKNVIEAETRLRKNTSRTRAASLQRQLDEAVFDLFGLGGSERILVRDAVEFVIDLRMNRERSGALYNPSAEELRAYANQVLETLNPFFLTLNERSLIAKIPVMDRGPLRVVHFQRLESKLNGNRVQTETGLSLEPVLDRIHKELPEQITDRVFAQRILKIYMDKDLYIIKRAQRRYWSRSAGMNDADEILQEHLGHTGDSK